MLMIDVANDRGDPECDPGSVLYGGSTYCGGINLFQMWESLFCMICFTVVVFIPFATFYYESDDEDLHDSSIKLSRFWPSFYQECVVVFAFLIMLLALYFTKADAEIPIAEQLFDLDSLQVVSYTRELGSSPYTFIDNSFSRQVAKNVLLKDTAIINIPVSFTVYLIAFFGWIGWWPFSLFLGVGLTCCPFDMITAYIWRPRVLAPDVMANKELEMQERTREIMEIVSLLKRERINIASEGGRNAKTTLRKRYMNDRMEVNRLTQMVYVLEKDLEDFRMCKAIRQNYNPLIPIFKLGIGILFSILSILWILQIILAVLTDPAVTPFLSLYLLSFDVWFPMFGTLTYALFSLYLLVCTVKGCFKLSVRFSCIKIHPMEIGGTYVNAFLFNIGIVMLATIPLIQFCVEAFSGYTVNTDAYFLFQVQVKYVHFFRAFFMNHVFVWTILLIACILLPYLFWSPRDKAISTEDFRRQMQDRANKSSGGYSLIPTSR